MICCLQLRIDENPSENRVKSCFYKLNNKNIIKILLNGLTYNPAEYFTRFSFETRKILSWIKCQNIQ